MNAAVAGAPVSFGVFELTPEGQETIGADELCGVLRDTGHTGIDLGPVGFLGRGPELRERLARYGLELAGGWIDLPLTDDDAFEAALPGLDDALRVFADAAEAHPSRLPLPTLAAQGSAARVAAPGRGSEVDALDDATWSRLARNLDRATARVRDAGFEPTFHHHAGTAVESPAEIDRLLELTDVGLTLDIGHLALGGGDAVEGVRRWGERIDHVHLKDVDLERLRAAVHAGGGMREVWASGVFVPFGAGDVDIDGVMAELELRRFAGWLVIEQDVLLTDQPLGEFVAERAADQRTNRDYLRRWV